MPATRNRQLARRPRFVSLVRWWAYRAAQHAPTSWVSVDRWQANQYAAMKMRMRREANGV